jgi:hypothetical protein
MRGGFVPGDVELFRVDRWSSAKAWPDDTSRVLMRLEDDGRYWTAVDGDPAAPFTVHVDSEYLRPLVVIDSEDREQVERLTSLFYNERDRCDRAAIVGGSTDAIAGRSPQPRHPAQATGAAGTRGRGRGR